MGCGCSGQRLLDIKKTPETHWFRVDDLKALKKNIGIDYTRLSNHRICNIFEGQCWHSSNLYQDRFAVVLQCWRCWPRCLSQMSVLLRPWKTLAVLPSTYSNPTSISCFSRSVKDTIFFVYVDGIDVIYGSSETTFTLSDQTSLSPMILLFFVAQEELMSYNT